MAMPQALRHQHLDFLPQQFTSRITEEFFDLRVDDDNLSLAVNDDDRVRRASSNPRNFPSAR